ncbi:NlpC/P60 family protein [uncultured Merdimonas sp.]|uniref:C40 family peptidase n=1 Tax=uncultured Merdimonas sp. TaxID=2023269 RepID=UPI00320B7318
MKKKYVSALITVLVMSVSFGMQGMAAPKDQNVEALETQKAQVESEAANVQQQLVGLLLQYNALQLDIENQKARVGQAAKDLKAAEEKEQQQYQDMKKRIRYIYEAGDASFIETLVSAKSFTDLINKAEYIQNIHSYDRTQLKEYVKAKEEVAEKKLELEAGQADMEQMSQDMGRQQTQLQGTLDTMRSQIADFDSQLESARATVAEQLTQLTEATENMIGSAEEKNPEDGQEEDQTPAPPANSENNNGGGTSKPSGGSTGNKPSGGGASKPSGGNSTPSGGNSTPSGGGTASTPDNASLGQQIADKACQYVGNPYKYGGTSLTNGADCSGFVMSVHALFGISTPRDSWGQLGGGKAVNYSDMLPGDVIVYSNHVAIYIGGNQIVHASNSAPYPTGGIKISTPPNYRTVLGVRRYW